MSKRPSDSAAQPVSASTAEHVVGRDRQQDLPGMRDRDQPSGTSERWADRLVVAHLQITKVDRDAEAFVHDRTRRSHGVDRVGEEDIPGSAPRSQLDSCLLRRGLLQ